MKFIPRVISVFVLAAALISCSPTEPRVDHTPPIDAMEASLQPSLVFTGEEAAVVSLQERMEQLSVPGVSIAVFNMLGDVEVTEHTAAALCARLPEETDVLVTADPQLLHDAVVMYQANQRQGSHQTKTRAHVSGTTKKMYRQKGTGNARAGSKRSGVRRGGGHIFAKQPRDWNWSVSSSLSTSPCCRPSSGW